MEPTAIVPDRSVRPGLNETGSTIARRLFVKKVAGSAEDSIAPGAAATDLVFGASMAAILDDQRGDVQTEGQAIVTSGAAVARGDEVASDAAGKAQTAVAGNYVAGIARSAATAADQDIEIELVGPNSGRIKA